MIRASDLKKDFPIFSHHRNLVYLDSAATSLKPMQVVKKEEEYYTSYSANIHRGVYKISERATEEYEDARRIVSLFIHAARPEEIIFTRGTTESINLVASSLGREILQDGDEVVVSILDHHSNFAPWQQLAMNSKAVFHVIPITSELEIDEAAFARLITPKTKILALPYVSNVTGTRVPLKKLISIARKINPDIITLVDAAQAVSHMHIDVRELDCDFLAFSGHKMLGPTGVGVLYGRYEILEKMSPYQFGGSMISRVTESATEFADIPARFEAGTPPIAQVIALKSAIEYLEYHGLTDIHSHIQSLTKYAVRQLEKAFAQDISIYIPKHPQSQSGVLAFSLKGIHPHDIAQILDEDEIAIRAGHHCAQPLHTYLGIPASARMSFYLYNTEEDIDHAVESLKRAQKMFNIRS